LNTSYLIGVIGAVTVLAWTILLVRRGLLGEKFAGVWLAVSTICLLLALAPRLLYVATSILGFSLPVNLLFVGGAIVELVVSVQLSIEIGKRQAETQRLAEELAILEARLSAFMSMAEKGSEVSWKVPLS
jgi:hypothetical protein